ncbi:trihelix transcription factor PTL-like [Cucurbita moschata]|uniref:Trihelix transcription factor PTL-like n=1 Tax=Cucurbita moschata TaxID=3662 RepID=A0A6J1GZJ9_CUCMO|nr:trihelix transcription factor PTL-like [Cucurbita moschata]
MSDKHTHPDLRHLMANEPNFPATAQTLDSFFHHHTHLTRGFSPPPPPKFQPIPLVLTDPATFPNGQLHFGCSDNSTTTAGGGGAASSAPFSRRNKAVDGEWRPYGNDAVGVSNGANSRWPRQETLTLLEIRSRLDPKFKESNQKGPLWDQVSRMMAEEYGYKRSGRKCKEKFDNLYKYYKKTKEGKSGRHDGKHYRFFRQLEAIYGDCNHQLSSPVTGGENHVEAGGMSQSFSMSSDFETSSSGNYHDDDLSAIAFMMNQRRVEKGREDDMSKGEGVGWREEVERMVDSKVRRLMEVQENWMEKIIASVEDGEKERIVKEEEWRKKEVARFDREMLEFCARERAWVRTREAAFMEIINNFSGKG